MQRARSGSSGRRRSASPSSKIGTGLQAIRTRSRNASSRRALLTPPARPAPQCAQPPAAQTPAGQTPAAPSTAAQTAPPATPALTDSGGFLLDNVSLIELVDILARRLKINYILDPRVNGKVTIHT